MCVMSPMLRCSLLLAPQQLTAGHGELRREEGWYGSPKGYFFICGRVNESRGDNGHPKDITTVRRPGTPAFHYPSLPPHFRSHDDKVHQACGPAQGQPPGPRSVSGKQKSTRQNKNQRQGAEEYAPYVLIKGMHPVLPQTGGLYCNPANSSICFCRSCFAFLVLLPFHGGGNGRDLEPLRGVVGHGAVPFENNPFLDIQAWGLDVSE